MISEVAREHSESSVDEEVNPQQFNILNLNEKNAKSARFTVPQN